MKLVDFKNDGLINPFYVTGLFRYPLKTLENERLLVFSGGYIKGLKWHELS